MDQATNQTQLNWGRRTFPDTDKWRHRERERDVKVDCSMRH